MSHVSNRIDRRILYGRYLWHDMKYLCLSLVHASDDGLNSHKYVIIVLKVKWQAHSVVLSNAFQRQPQIL